MSQEMSDRDYEISHYRTQADDMHEKQQLAEKRETEAFDKLAHKESIIKQKEKEVQEINQKFSQKEKEIADLNK